MLVSRHTPNRGYKWQDFSVQCTNDEAGERERERERERNAHPSTMTSSGSLFSIRIVSVVTSPLRKGLRAPPSACAWWIRASPDR